MLIDVLALVFGILFSIRKLEIRRTVQPDVVSLEQFEAWQERALRAYNLGILACFGKVVLDYGFQFLAGRFGAPWGAIRLVGAGLFFGWIAGVVACFVLAGRARRLGQELGIETGPRAPAPPSEP